MSIAILPDINPASPDLYVKAAGARKAGLAKLAHLKAVVDKLNEVTTEVNNLSIEGYKGVIDCSTGPNYPVATANWYYRVSVAGTIGGAIAPNAANGQPVEVGDMIICITDNATAGTHTAVGDHFMIVEKNVNFGTITSFAIINQNGLINANLSALDLNAHFNDKKDVHQMDSTYLIKHQLMVTALYDFAVDGTANTVIDLNSGVDMIPVNAIITKVYYDVITNFNSTSGTSTFKFKTETADLTAAVTADNTNVGIYDGIPTGLATNMIKTSGGATKIQLELSVADLTAGKAQIYIEYVVSQ